MFVNNFTTKINSEAMSGSQGWRVNFSCLSNIQDLKNKTLEEEKNLSLLENQRHLMIDGSNQRFSCRNSKTF